MPWSSSLPAASRSRRNEARRGGGTRPHSDARMAWLSVPLSRITAMAACPAPEATAKMVSASMPPYVSPTQEERNAMAAPENLLRHETSPYLLQHADNPVHWRPWGAAALEEARDGEQADPAVDRLCRLPLVPCHGARVVRGPGHRGADERAVRQHQGGPRGAAGHRPPLHVGAARAGRAGRLAADHVHRPGRRPVLGRHLFPAGAALGAAVVPPGADTACRRHIAPTTRWWRRTPPRCAGCWRGCRAAIPAICRRRCISMRSRRRCCG